MAIIVERTESRAAEVNLENPSIELDYVIFETYDEIEVATAIEAQVPAFFSTSIGILVLHSYNYRHNGAGKWYSKVKYERRGKNDIGLPRPPGEPPGWQFQFDTTGGTQHITQSLETITRWGVTGQNPADCPNTEQAIGVGADRVEGVDITVPVYNYTETWHLPIAAVDGAYKRKLFELTGTVNNTAFRGLERGENLFLGARGSQRNQEDFEITYHFAASLNGTLKFGQIQNVTKKGWEYVWVMYKPQVDQKRLIKIPEFVFVEQVYREADHNELGI